jgi:hypothetical protein
MKAAARLGLALNARGLAGPLSFGSPPGDESVTPQERAHIPVGGGTMSEIWTPGHGLVPAHIRSAQKAVEEYDVDMSIGRDDSNGQWVVLLARGPEGRPFPVLGLGVELPAPEEIKRKLYMSDTRKRGREIVMDIERHNERARQALRDKTHQAGGEVAETMDTALHLMKRHPVPRIFVPSGKGN